MGLPYRLYVRGPEQEYQIPRVGNLELLQLVLDDLEKNFNAEVPEFEFNMMTWVHPRDPETANEKCGTSLCIGGDTLWLAGKKEELLDWYHNRGWLSEYGQPNWPMNEATRLLEIPTPEEANLIFFSSNWPWHIRDLVDDRSAEGFMRSKLSGAIVWLQEIIRVNKEQYNVSQ